jgi:hypothetical protein
MPTAHVLILLSNSLSKEPCSHGTLPPELCGTNHCLAAVGPLPSSILHLLDSRVNTVPGVSGESVVLAE